MPSSPNRPEQNCTSALSAHISISFLKNAHTTFLPDHHSTCSYLPVMYFVQKNNMSYFDVDDTSSQLAMVSKPTSSLSSIQSKLALALSPAIPTQSTLTSLQTTNRTTAPCTPLILHKKPQPHLFVNRAAFQISVTHPTSISPPTLVVHKSPQQCSRRFEKIVFSA
jgi:hypothetical protein